MSGVDPRSAVESAARTSRLRLVALLASVNGDLTLAEDAVAIALERALAVWARSGVPENPEGWLVTVARNHQRDVWKSSAARTAVPLDRATDSRADVVRPWDDVDSDAIPDRRLALLFVCAHPAIDAGARTPLMLQVVLGFDAAHIARVFAVSEATMAQRLVRAKRRIRDSRIPFVVPDRSVVTERLPAVLEAVYGCFAISWRDADGARHDRPESMAGESLYLAVTLATLLDDEPEAWGLASLIAFALSRARTRGSEYVPLEDQDPRKWDAELIREGEDMLRRAASDAPPGRFQLEAAIQSVHATRRQTGVVDRQALETLSAALVRAAPGAGAWIAHAAIVGANGKPKAGLQILDDLEATLPHAGSLQSLHAARASLLVRAGRGHEARDSFERAGQLTDSADVRAWLSQQAAALPGKTTDV